MKPIDTVSPGKLPGQIRPVVKTDQPARAETRTEARASEAAVRTGTSSEAPVDTNRVTEIRTALREGRYPLVPVKIADAMIAAKFMLVEKE